MVECDEWCSAEYMSDLVEARLDLPITRCLVAEGFELSMMKSCYESQLRLRDKLELCGAC